MTPLLPWMRYLLRFVAVYNVLAGLVMLVFYHESFKFLGVQKPTMNLPIQLDGALVILFGVGYWLVQREPLDNRNLLRLGMWSKALGSLLGTYYVWVGKLPPVFFALLFVSDIIYLPPFWVMQRRIDRLAAERKRQVAELLGEATLSNAARPTAIRPFAA
ncbi:MAG: hypothetical protein K2Y37_18135 [Pirellulales bacterium]|nr:hypothetical protein [Pirellulales bacterium]